MELEEWLLISIGGAINIIRTGRVRRMIGTKQQVENLEN